MNLSAKPKILTTKVYLANLDESFANWQAKLNSRISSFPGFVSLEILISKDEKGHVCSIVQRFKDVENASAWRESKERKELLEELHTVLRNEPSHFVVEEEVRPEELSGGVTEVFVTQVNPEKREAFREWLARVHQVEAKFPGFRGMYIQSPEEGKGVNWITLLQFDTAENLDRWMHSAERLEVLKESKPIVALMESHRVISPYAGWFSTLAKSGSLPSAWKQSMVVLLVLFPIVMLELKYLNPLTKPLDLSLATFIGNAISVSLLTWPSMPIAIWALSWWLSPKTKSRKAAIYGALLVFALYATEIAIFWNFV